MQPFSGLTVVERASFVAGPYAAKLLADLGANVIKLESIDGDPARRIGPFLDPPADYGALFLYCNGTKRSVTLDDSKASGRSLFRRLLDHTDVFVSDASHTELDRLGIGPRQLSTRWPRLILASVRPYGLTGPLAEVRSHELDAFHSGGEGKLLPGGLAYQLFPDRAPVKAGRHIAGYDSGVALATLVAAALLRRERTGRGDLIDVSQQEVEISLNRMNLDAQLNAGMALSRAHRGYDFGGIFACLDGYVTVRPNENRHWAGLARGLGREDLIDDPRFAQRKARRDNANQLNNILQEFFSRHTMVEIYDQLGRFGTPVGYFADAAAIHASDQFQARGWFASTQLYGQKADLPRPPYRMSATPPKSPSAAPRLGEHNAEVYGAIGFNASHRSSLKLVSSNVRSVGLLSGFRIVDTSWAAAGPYATELMALLGAEVIKVETAGHPDLFRRVLDDPAASLDASTRFNALNLRKRGLRVNLHTPGGLEIFKRLIAKSDAFVENYRPGVVERLGISYWDLIQFKPDLVMASISAAGRGGPKSDQPGYASIFNAMGGLGHLTGYRDGPPTEVRDSVDLRVASIAAFAVVGALFHRHRTGVGQWIDISALESIASFVGDALVEYTLTGVSPTRDGNGQSLNAPYNVFPCKGQDSWVAIGVTTDEEWIHLSEVMGRPDLATDERYSDRLLRYEHQNELEAIVSAWTAGMTAAEAANRCRVRGVAATEVLGGSELLCDPHILARNVFQTVSHPLLGAQRVIRAPWRLGSEEPPLEPSPLLGADNEAILSELLGYSGAEIEAFQEACVFE